MIQYGNLFFPDGERILPEHMAAQGNVEICGKSTYQWTKLARAIPLIKNFRHAVDVGANVGTWAHVLARLFGKVTCFEPVPAVADCLEKNIERDKDHVTIHRVALGAAKGEVGLRLSEGSSGWTHAMPTDEKGAKFLETLHTKQYGDVLKFDIVKAPVETLDSYNLEQVDFLKVDVEGFEYHVVQGGAATIKRCKPTIIIEQKPGTPDRYGLKAQGAVDLLLKMGAKQEFVQSGDYCLTFK
jgi:FkbM family methyltransferase